MIQKEKKKHFNTTFITLQVQMEKKIGPTTSTKSSIKMLTNDKSR